MDGNGDRDVLTVTGEHPFFLQGQGWTAADKLQVGERVQTVDGRWLRVVGLAAQEQRQRTYNLEVERDYTFFVGNTGAWVHNECITDILLPYGNPIGQPGSSPSIREVQGGIYEALNLFDKLTQGGRVEMNPGYPGLRIIRSDGGVIGLRTQATRSPRTAATVDINVPGIPFKKIKFNP
ncbi:polymorphic toxin-type HINT domain-containing protein [Gloeobacter violaceus]|uniref:polymorphic toxin-type HINT domain-containing protein n=1 Tax=Gloeobacter violaceus TaxID=33072 RepID=UPI0022B22540|nr:polymorphic toxin-type HINT domain-containing protein [Gloeobacter violaceus]